MSDVNFLNSYNEVILENLNAILKQNFLFQTQLKMLEEQNSVIPKLEEQINLVNQKLDSKIKDYEQLVITKDKIANELDGVRGDLNTKNAILQNNVQVDNDKNRLQTALNNQAKEIESLKLKMKSVDEIIGSKDEYIKQLEEMLPNSKRKKLGLEVPEIVEQVKPVVVKEEKKEEIAQLDDVSIVKVESSGGTF